MVGLNVVKSEASRGREFVRLNLTSINFICTYWAEHFFVKYFTLLSLLRTHLYVFGFCTYWAVTPPTSPNPVPSPRSDSHKSLLDSVLTLQPRSYGLSTFSSRCAKHTPRVILRQDAARRSAFSRTHTARRVLATSRV